MTQIAVRNLALGLKDQLVTRQALRNWVFGRDAWGIFSSASHVNMHSGKPKVSHPSKEKAERAALALQRQKGVDFDAYKCIFCDGYHVGRRHG